MIPPVRNSSAQKAQGVLARYCLESHRPRYRSPHWCASSTGPVPQPPDARGRAVRRQRDHAGIEDSAQIRARPSPASAGAPEVAPGGAPRSTPDRPRHESGLGKRHAVRLDLLPRLPNISVARYATKCATFPCWLVGDDMCRSTDRSSLTPKGRVGRWPGTTWHNLEPHTPCPEFVPLDSQCDDGSAASDDHARRDQLKLDAAVKQCGPVD